MTRLEPSDLGLTQCAACGHHFGDAEKYFRGVTTAAGVGIGFFIICETCFHEIQHAPEGSRAVALDERIERAALAHTPAAGHA